jgi:enoyl-CoA hydratase/carnithine racemase
VSVDDPTIDDLTIDLAAFGALLASDAEEGLRRVPPAVAQGTARLGVPLVVVDLDSASQRQNLRPAQVVPFVAVGVSRSGAYPGPFDCFDVVLVETISDVPAPWVAVPDRGPPLEQLVASITRSPNAASLLIQVLRTGEDASFADALVIESLAYSTLQGGPEFARWLAARPAPPPRPTEEKVLDVERVGDELRLVLDRPHVRNALNAVLRDALCEALAVPTVDATVASVHLFGRGHDFCSGGDLDEFGTAPDPVSAHLVRTSRSVAGALAPMAARTAAHLHGACIGAGIEIAAVADQVVAARDSEIRLPEVAMGLVPGAGGTASLPRRIGRHRTAWMALTGASLGAEVAHQWGLVDELVDEQADEVTGP